MGDADNAASIHSAVIQAGFFGRERLEGNFFAWGHLRSACR